MLIAGPPILGARQTKPGDQMAEPGSRGRGAAEKPSLPVRKVRDPRDRALLLLAYTLMARRSELVALDVESFATDDDGSATVTFERLKTGEVATNYLSPEVMAIVREYLADAKLEAGTLFRRLDNAGRTTSSRITGRSVGIAFKRIAKMLSLTDLDPARISSHSARIGATHDLVEDGASDAAIMRDAGWKTPRMVAMCSRGAQAKRGAMAARLKRLAQSFALGPGTNADPPKTGEDVPDS